MHQDPSGLNKSAPSSLKKKSLKPWFSTAEYSLQIIYSPNCHPRGHGTPVHRELSRQIMLNSHNPDRKTAYTGGLGVWGDVKITKDYRRGKGKSARKGDTKWSWLVNAEQREICTT